MSKSKPDKNRQDFLLTFFIQISTEYYEEKEVNGFWLVKSFNGGTGNWQVSIYTRESFKRYQDYNRLNQNLT